MKICTSNVLSGSKDRVLMTGQAPVLVLAVAAVGVLHTMVPDHWAPIALLARQRGWSSFQTARAAALAGTGHTVSTLIIAVVVWGAGAVLAVRFGHLVGTLSSVALVIFGAWIALASWREIALKGRDREHAHRGHAHLHRHQSGIEHRHWHEHDEHDWHEINGTLALVPIHDHAHDPSSRTALLLILGSSPMVEGIPAFFAASRYGIGLLAVMAVVFAAATIATYVVLCVASASGIQRINLGRFEQFGEIVSGAFIALLGLLFLLFASA